MSKKKLSVCIAFRNEKDQVYKTIKSLIESVNFNVHDLQIVVVNDQSDDDYDYSYLAYYPYVDYFINEKRLGSSQTKQKAIELATSDYVFVIDAHMRFYNNGFDSRIISEIDKDNKKIYALYTIGFDPDYDDKPVKLSHRCTVLGFSDKLLFGSTWTNNDLDKDKSNSRVSVVMGASYFFSKKYFNYLNGFKGLKLYGREEEYISIKSWGIGNGCMLIKDCEVAHLYRKVAPQPITRKEVWHNILFIAETLLDEDTKIKIADKMIEKDNATFKKVYESIDHKLTNELKDYYLSLGYDYNKFKFINDLVINNK